MSGAAPLILGNVIEGNTLAASTSGFGGGIYCDTAAPLIAGNVLRGNDAGALGAGGGIYCRASRPVVVANTIQFNRAGRRGGGVCTEANSDPLVAFNTISGNEVRYSGVGAGGLGGGIFCERAQIISNVIYGNVVRGANPSGGGVSCTGAVLEANLIFGNLSRGTAVGSAGGVAAVGGATLQGNHIVGNAAAGGASQPVRSWGGGLVLVGGLAAGNVLAGNSADAGGGLVAANGARLVNETVFGNRAHVAGGGGFGGAVTVTNCILWGDRAPNGPEFFVAGGTLTLGHSLVGGGKAALAGAATVVWGAGMLTGDPRFVDPALGDLHLQADSPCRDAGVKTVTGLPPRDWEGDPRVGGAMVDIGADEFYPHLYHTGAVRPGGALALRLVGYPGRQSWVGIGTALLRRPLTLPGIAGLLLVDPTRMLVAPLGPLGPRGVQRIRLPLGPGVPRIEVYGQGLVGAQLTNLDVIAVR